VVTHLKIEIPLRGEVNASIYGLCKDEKMARAGNVLATAVDPVNEHVKPLTKNACWFCPLSR
jgi:hypothetical protein